MGAPSDQFLHLLWRPPYVFFFHTIWWPLGSVLCILYWGPQITFFAYYMGPLRLVSSHTIWGPLSDQFHCLLYAPPPPIRSVSLHAIGPGPPQILVFSQSIWGPPQISFSAYYMGPLRSVSSLTIGGPLRPPSSLNIWVPPPPPPSQFLRLLYGGLLRPISSLIIYGASSDQFLRLLYGGPPQVSFFAYCMGAPLRSVSSHTI